MFLEITCHEPIPMCIQYREIGHISLMIFHIGFNRFETEFEKWEEAKCWGIEDGKWALEWYFKTHYIDKV